MRTILPLVALLAASPALAQQPPAAADPQAQALGQTVMDLIGQVVSLRTQLIASQAETKRLHDEAAKTAAPPATR